MDYTARYGLEFNPFLKNSKEVLVETQEYKEVLFRLNYLLTTKGFGLLTGSAGRGKTTAVRNWASGLNTSLYKVVYSSLSTLTVNDFYRNLAAELGAQPTFRKTDNFKIIQDEINRLVLEKRQTPVIIIDEANYIGNAVLNDLKMLFNFEMDSKDRAVVLLSGLPQLNSTLRLSIHEPFRQRIVMNYNLEGMTKAEGHSYVAAKLNGAGCTQTVFEDNALEAILNAANGTPRMINKLSAISALSLCCDGWGRRKRKEFSFEVWWGISGHRDGNGRLRRYPTSGIRHRSLKGDRPGIIEKSCGQRGSGTTVPTAGNGVGLDGGAITSRRPVDRQLYLGLCLHINSPHTWHFSINPGSSQAGNSRFHTGRNT